ncbi:MSCRAMM family protein [Micromonospora peucetia]|uniref:Carboxypeptidase regulatory-like domain-containing protein n=1 Tax=Micromonospora peucetia TaxID=47871 RepID=A0A1C6W4A1_9ACTN|nr:carboxypeptidase-like regulatory domain-containing protein [Micromonospora peucetia]WSA32494.1 carboxypeptidase-like regulatory domain-containing protein [Micromonospora peucetia]SCL73363.1 Carboxypeptidase regulatory-like domain-containing protein [Micromonospora peucetia]
MPDSLLRPRARVTAALAATLLLLSAALGPAAAGHAAATATGSVRTTVQDAGTGQPARACVSLVPLDRERLTRVYIGESQLGRFGGCTDEQGRIEVTGVEPGRYRLFAQPYETERYGRQWVGGHGGTGQRHRAWVVLVGAGATSTAPRIRLDPPGRISGRVTDAVTGLPVAGAHVAVVPFVPHPKYTPDTPISDDTGRYTVTGLGPYDWALRFSGPRIAAQWSGGVGGALLARTVRVRPGGTATLDQALRPPTTVRGSIRVDEPAAYGTVVAFDAVTAEVTGAVDVGTSYDLPMLPGQLVRLRCDCSFGPGRWYPAGSGFTDGLPVWVGRAPVTADFDLTAGADG